MTGWIQHAPNTRPAPGPGLRTRHVLGGILTRPWMMASLLVIGLTTGAGAQTERPLFLALGDSLSQGVQSADAGWQVTPGSHIVLVARRMGLPAYQIPLITSSPVASVFSRFTRRRLNPRTETYNLAVAGATVESLLRDRATAERPADIVTETDLVLYPLSGSQVEIAESIRPRFATCWIGGNDGLSAAIAFDQYDGSQLTPIADFADHFGELTRRLAAAEIQVLYGTIPPVSAAGFLLDAADLTRILGADFGLPPGHFTSIPAGILLLTGLADASLLRNPDWVLDPDEIRRIDDRIDHFNEIIRTEADAVNADVIEYASLFQSYLDHPPVIAGLRLTGRLFGGLTTLDGVHPSNTGQLLIARELIPVVNQVWGFSLRPVSDAHLAATALRDPYVDLDGDSKIRGRAGAGLLESFAMLLGFIDTEEQWRPFAPRPKTRPRYDGAAWKQAFLPFKGEGRTQDMRHRDFEAAVRLLKSAFPSPS